VKANAKWYVLGLLGAIAITTLVTTVARLLGLHDFYVGLLTGLATGRFLTRWENHP
jgi:hypothetical protein